MLSLRNFSMCQWLFAGILSVCFSLHAAPLMARANSPDTVIYFTTDSEGLFRIVVKDAKFAAPPEQIGPRLAGGFKLAWNENSGLLGAAFGGKTSPALLLVNPDSLAASHVAFDAEISDLAAWGEGFVAAASKGLFYFVSPDGAIERWSARKELTPPGRKGENFLVLEEENLALVTFQKDDDDSEACGNRVVILGRHPLRAIHDLPLPAASTQFSPDETLEKLGPEPEVLLASTKTNTLLITADAYGAVAFTDLDAALRGEWKNFAYVSSAENGEWGTSFPDRATLISLGSGDYALVANASKDGGLALFDLAARNPVQFFPAPAGADAPLYYPSLRVAATVVSGKIKSREESAKKFRPGSELLVFEFPETATSAKFRRITLSGETLRIARAGANLCVVFVRKNQDSLEAQLFRLPEGRLLDTIDVPGAPVRALGVIPKVVE